MNRAATITGEELHAAQTTSSSFGDVIMPINRQELRARLKQAERGFRAHGIAPEKNIFPLILLTRELIRILENKENARRASDAAQRNHDEFDKSLRNFPPQAPVACRKGCAYCCHTWVSATAPEILLIARRLRRFPSEEFKPLLAHIVDAESRTRGQELRQRFQSCLPCALLKDNLCSMYEVRPNACRAFASESLRACEAWANGIPVPAVEIPVPASNMELRGAHDFCLWAALKAIGLPWTMYELSHAVRIAIETEKSEHRWLEGEDIFAGVLTDPTHSGLPVEILEQQFAVLIAGARKQPVPENPWI